MNSTGRELWRRLKVKHIDSAQETIRVEQSKGRKDRNVMLSPVMLNLLRAADEQKTAKHPCPCCGSPMRIIETFLRGQQPQNYPTPGAPKIRIDTS